MKAFLTNKHHLKVVLKKTHHINKGSSSEQGNHLVKTVLMNKQETPHQGISNEQGPPPGSSVQAPPHELTLKVPNKNYS